MELRVFSKTLEPLGAVDELATLIWKIKYFDVGSFSLLAPITSNNSNLIVQGNIIIKHDGKQEIHDSSGGIWRRAAQITYVHITKDEKGQEQIEAQGFMLGNWLSKRVVNPQLVTTATCQSIITTQVKNNCGSSASTKRRFTQFALLPQENLGGSAVEYSNEKYVDLGLEVKAKAQDGKLGYDILVNERSKTFGFYLYKGKDLTATNSEGNTPCIFSRDFDNVNEQEYEDSIENYKNFIYVQGAADDAGSQPVVTVDGGNKTGLELAGKGRAYMTPANYIAIAALLVSLIMMVVNTGNITKNQKKAAEDDTKEETAKQTSIMIALDNIKSMLSDIKEEINTVKQDTKENHEDIILIKASQKSEHKRLDGHEERLNNIEQELRERKGN
ncbi:MAG: hypothetical protein EOM40_10055 [Clostridia bacterium]|nr:hypothetical protein [Clostridia bacterium]